MSWKWHRLWRRTHDLQERVVKLKAKMVFKALNGLLPSYIAEKFLRFSAVHVRETRN